MSKQQYLDALRQAMTGLPPETVAKTLAEIDRGERDAALAETLATLRKEQLSAGKTAPS